MLRTVGAKVRWLPGLAEALVQGMLDNSASPRAAEAAVVRIAEVLSEYAEPAADREPSCMAAVA